MEATIESIKKRLNVTPFVVVVPTVDSENVDKIIDLI